MKKGLGLLVVFAALTFTGVGAASAPPPQTVAFTKLAKTVIKNDGGKTRFIAASCTKQVETRVYVCTLKADDVAGKYTCANFYTAFRGSAYGAILWPSTWKCGHTRPQLPPIPPLSVFDPVAKSPAE